MLLKNSTAFGLSFLLAAYAILLTAIVGATWVQRSADPYFSVKGAPRSSEVRWILTEELRAVPAHVRDSQCVAASIFASFPEETRGYASFVNDLVQRGILDGSGVSLPGLASLLAGKGLRHTALSSAGNPDFLRQAVAAHQTGKVVFLSLGGASFRDAAAGRDTSLAEQLGDFKHMVRLASLQVDGAGRLAHLGFFDVNGPETSLVWIPAGVFQRRVLGAISPAAWTTTAFFVEKK